MSKVTFEEMCPKWAKVVERSKESGFSLTDEESTDLECTMSRCIVGEAYGWTARYSRWYPKHCEECLELAYTLSNHKYWEKHIPEFTEHWNEKHTCQK
jgi:hypothetical protein